MANVRTQPHALTPAAHLYALQVTVDSMLAASPDSTEPAVHVCLDLKESLVRAAIQVIHIKSCGQNLAVLFRYFKKTIV